METTKTYHYNVTFLSPQHVDELGQHLNQMGLNGFRLFSANVTPNGGVQVIMEREAVKSA